MDLKKLSDIEHQQAEEQMRESLVDEPQVGIFWYTRENGLFGEQTYPASKVVGKGLRTLPKRHDQVWRKEHYRAKARNKVDSPFYSDEDVYSIPRGRVFVNEDGTCIVMVGKWIEDYPEAKEEILDVFNLPQDTEFRYDTHWDIGHGWSGDHM